MIVLRETECLSQRQIGRKGGERWGTLVAKCTLPFVNWSLHLLKSNDEYVCNYGAQIKIFLEIKKIKIDLIELLN